MSLTFSVIYYEDYYFDDSTSKAMLDALKNDKLNAPEKEDFNARELQIIRAVCNGQTNKQIAEDLYLSAKTIDFHKGKIYQKANCNNVAGLLQYAIKKGICVI